MDLSQKIIAAILAGFFLVALIRVFSSPFRLALKLLLNTLLGFLALGAGLCSAVGSKPDSGRHRHRPGAEPVECPGDRRSGPAGICAAAVGPVDLVALHIVFKRQGSSSPRASKYRSTRRQPMSPPVNRQMVRDGGAGMETDSSRPASTRSRTSVSFSDSFPMT